MPGRRGHGEGSIYRRESDGKWCCVVDLGRVNGKRRHKTLYGRTRKEVTEALKKVLREQQQRLPIATERRTVAQYLVAWLEATRPRLRASTLTRYEQLIRRQIIPALGPRQLDRLRPEEVEAMLRAILDAGISARTAHHARAVLRRALNQAVRWGYIARNPATLVDPPAVPHYRARPLTPEEASRFLAVATGNRLEALYRVALSLALRQGEALGLRWRDIDFAARTLRVEVALQPVAGQLVLVEPKTPQSRRTLPLPPTLLAALRAHHARQLAERAAAGEGWEEWDLVFSTRLGRPIHRRNLIRAFHGLREKAGLPHLRFHDLRHSCLSLLAAQGVPARVAMEIAGHSDIRLTLSVYTHAYDDDKRRAAEALERLLDEPPDREP